MKKLPFWPVIACSLLMALGCRTQTVEKAEFAASFEKEGYAGSLLLYDSRERTYFAYNRTRVDSQFMPASTYKIFNSLVALETGVAPDENLVIPWDSVERSFAPWNQSHTLRSAYKVSCVPYYREIARRVGRASTQKYLDQEGYGNATIGPEEDFFWLDGSLKISQREQIEMLRKLCRGKLGFSQRSQDIVRDIMIEEAKNDYILRSKTGWGIVEGHNYGWYVGWVEREDGNCFFALNIFTDDPRDNFTAARKRIVRDVLDALGWLK